MKCAVSHYAGRPQRIRQLFAHRRASYTQAPVPPHQLEPPVPPVTPKGLRIGQSTVLRAMTTERRSPDAVASEISRCYEIIKTMGRGTLYLGSSRVAEDHPHYQQAKQLSQDVAKLFGGSTTWSGAGAGFMGAVSSGAMEAGFPVAGFMIEREGGKWVGAESSKIHKYLPDHAYTTCEFFSARKHGLVETVTRSSESDRTAVITFPGGTGTMDEFFEIAVLLQLDRMGTEFEVPLLLMNYDSFYDNMLKYLDDCVDYGAVYKNELQSMFTICRTNEEALEHLEKFYSLP